jgi:hypothetical protein
MNGAKFAEILEKSDIRITTQAEETKIYQAMQLVSNETAREIFDAQRDVDKNKKDEKEFELVQVVGEMALFTGAKDLLMDIRTMQEKVSGWKDKLANYYNSIQ